MDNLIDVPSRFENVLPHFSNNLDTILIEVPEDTEAFVNLVRKVKVQNGGVLSFIKGGTGVGKTTAVYSMPIWRSDLFNEVIIVPEEINYPDITQWIRNNVSQTNDKINIILLDGREITSDAIGLSNLFTSLNQLLRKRKDLIVCWPANDEEWLNNLVLTARKVGGNNFVPKKGIIDINGPKKDKWNDILDRLLIYMDKTIADLAIDEQTLREIEIQSPTIGEYLSEVGELVSERIIDERDLRSLPEVVFVISSGEKVESEANRIRRAASYILKAEELTSYSRNSSSGKFWVERGKRSNKESLAYVITLLNAKLTTVKPTAVNYSALFCDEDILVNITKVNNITKNSANAKRAIESTDFYKYLNDDISFELTSSNKGKMSDNTKKAYDLIQSKSALHHKKINKAICSYVQEVIGDETKFKVINYEVDGGDGGLYMDVLVSVNGRELSLEFHHLSAKNCKASKMSSYIMEKLKNYAQHYNLVTR